MKSAPSLSQQHTVCLKRKRKRNSCSLVPQIDESAVDDRVLADAIARSRPASVDTRGPSTLNAKVYLGHHVVWKLLARNFATLRCHLSKFCISPFCFSVSSAQPKHAMHLKRSPSADPAVFESKKPTLEDPGTTRRRKSFRLMVRHTVGLGRKSHSSLGQRIRIVVC